MLTPNASPRHLLGAELRLWREARGLSAAQLAAQVFVSADLAHKVEKAQRRATLALINACDGALNTGGVLGRLLAFALCQEQRPERPGQPGGARLAVPPQPVSIVVTITADVVAPTAPAGTADAVIVGTESARIYQFPPVSTRERS